VYAIRTDCIVKFEKNFFVGSYKKPKFSHSAVLSVKVLKHSYGALKGQHTFTVEVLECDTDDHKVGEIFCIKGRNLYKNIIEHIQSEQSIKESR